MRIHRGAAEVGGSCVEIEAGNGDRVVVDVGLPLQGPGAYRDLLPDVPGLWAEGDGSLKAVLLTHGHPDHTGLADLVTPAVPVCSGAATQRIAEAAAFFRRTAALTRTDRHFDDGEPFAAGAITVTPFLVDHSAHDAYAFLLESEGRKLLVSGDLRGHGRRPGLLRRLERIAATADATLLEGTMLGRRPSTQTEDDVEDAIADRCEQTDGLVLAAASAQNVERTQSLHRAALRSGRELVVDLYAAAVLSAAAHPLGPVPGARGLRVFLPHAQRRLIIERQAFERVDAVRPLRVFGEELAVRPDDFLMLFRTSMAADLERMPPPTLDGAHLVWSMWTGYRDRDARLDAFLHRHEITESVAHAGGHAQEDVLRRVAAAAATRGVVVPIHTDRPDLMREFGHHVRVHPDGAWWTV